MTVKFKLYDEGSDKTYNKSFTKIPDVSPDTRIVKFAHAYDAVTTDSILDPVYKVKEEEVSYE